jgi:30S ribosomal protein S31
MGKGDKKTKRGKITIGSFGVRRARKKQRITKKPVVSAPEAKPAKAKPQPAKVIREVDLEEAPVVQSNTPAENVEVTEPKEKKKAPAKPKTPKAKKADNPDESQQQLL